MIVVGTGFGGCAMGAALKREGIDDFLLLERADRVGGPGQDNTCPGCSCDVPSHLYSLSFAPDPEWARTFSRQPDIHAYSADVVVNGTGGLSGSLVAYVVSALRVPAARNTTQWPGSTLTFRRSVRRFDPTEFHVTTGPETVRARR